MDLTINSFSIKRLLFIAIILHLNFVNAKAQNYSSIADSLINELAQVSSDTGKVKLLYAISSHFRRFDLDKAEQYATQALDLAQQSNYILGETKSLYTLSVIYRKQGLHKKALDFGNQSFQLAASQSNWHWMAANKNSLGNVYKYLGTIDTAIACYFDSAELYKKAGLPSKAANAYNNLGNAFSKQKRNDLAVEYLEKALKIYSKDGSESKTAIALMNLGNKIQDSEKAIDYFNQALVIHTKNNNIEGEASVNINLARRHIKDKTYEAGLPYAFRGLDLITNLGHKNKMAIAHRALGTIYYNLGETQKAIEQYEAGLKLTAETNYINEERVIYYNLYQLYKAQDDYKKAMDALSITLEINDSIVNKENLKIAAELETRYDEKEKEALLAQQQLTIAQQKNKENRILLLGALALLLISAVFQYYYYRQKRKKQEALNLLAEEQIRAENLQELDELKTKFFANISHELKTPLSMVITPLEEALQTSSDDNLVLAHHNGKKLFGLIHEILDLAKLEAGQLELNKKSVQLSSLVRRIFYSFQSIAQSKSIELKLQYDLVEYLGVEIDIDKFEKILNNLISNAIKFSDRDSQVVLAVNKTEIETKEHLIFKVTDQGSGIESDDLPHIFNRFYQTKSGKKAGGTGIGLALSKELAQLFGGNLIAESTLKQGSTFTLNIPLIKVEIENRPDQIIDPSEKFIPETQAMQRTGNTYEPILLNGKKPHVLIVEDNPEMSNFLSRILAPYYQCSTAFNGREALQQLSAKTFDLVTSDVMMPEMDGFEFRKTMSKNNYWRQLPFIMLTASSLEENKLRGFNLGIDDYITKPFSSKELLVRIDNLLKNKQERDRFLQEDIEPIPETADHQFLKKAEQIVLDHLNDNNFKVTDLAKEIGYSQRQLTRIIKKLTGLSPVNFILEIRLQKAYKLFQSRQFATVSEVRYEVGIESAAYFTNKFRARFGKNPKAYLE